MSVSRGEDWTVRIFSEHGVSSATWVDLAMALKM